MTDIKTVLQDNPKPLVDIISDMWEAKMKELWQYGAGVQQKRIQEFQAHIQEMKDLKSGRKKVEDLVVADNGYDFMPPPPAKISQNGVKEKVTT